MVLRPRFHAYVVSVYYLVTQQGGAGLGVCF